MQEENLKTDDQAVIFDQENVNPNLTEIYKRDMNALKIHSGPERKAPLFRICLTGGPCAGKTTAIAKLQRLLQNTGFRVFTVPEAATLLMKSGAMIDNGKMTEDASI